jgi:hypothetical protein
MIATASFTRLMLEEVVADCRPDLTAEERTVAAQWLLRLLMTGAATVVPIKDLMAAVDRDWATRADPLSVRDWTKAIGRRDP